MSLVVARGYGSGSSIAAVVLRGYVPSTSDTIPDAFSFISILGAATSTVYTSNTITITGIDVAVPYSVTGGEVSKNGGAYSASSGTCIAGDTFAIRLTSSGTGSVTTSAALTVSGVTGTYSVTTAAITTDTYTWTLTRERICDRVLMKCGRLASGESADYDDRALVVEGLESVLKNLHWRGYRWPKTASASYSLTLLASTQNAILPTDFYEENAINFIDESGQECKLEIIDFPTYKRLPNKAETADYPRVGYIDNFNVLWVWPVPNADVTAKLYYSKIVADTIQSSSTDLDSPWMLGLIYGVACEVGDEFGVNPQKMARFEAKWAQQLMLGISNEVPPSPDRVWIDD